MTQSTKPDSPVARAAAELLAVSLALRDAIHEEADAVHLDGARAAREAAFDRLRTLIQAGSRPDPQTRVDLARLRAIDAAMIDASQECSDGILDERQSLARRRSAIQAHATRERDAPRFVAVKA